MDLVNDLSRLIELNSFSGNKKAIEKTMDFIEYYFSSTNLIIKKFERNGYPSMVISTIDTYHPEVLMLANVDINKPNEFDPKDFKPELIDETFVGKGGFQMKGGLFVMMYVLRELSKLTAKPAVSLMITSDQENGGRDGVEYLVEKVGYRPMSVVALDSEEPEAISKSIKGFFHIHFFYEGDQTTHSSTPWLANNAIREMTNFFHELEGEFPHQASEKNEWKVSVTPTLMKAGEINNRVPHAGEMILDIRFTDSDEKEQILKAIDHHLPVNMSYEIVNFGNNFDIPYADEEIILFQKKLEKYMKRPAKLIRSNKSSDIRHFLEHEIPVVQSNILGAESTEKQPEWVSLHSMNQFTKILTEYILETHEGMPKED